jgi:AcrR family transcriptional regulator
MTSPGDKGSTGRRPHDADASRRALLEAGRALFDEVGFDRATTREIGERAGVDPALIARYFGGKEGLFLAALAEPPLGDGGDELDLEPGELLAFLLRRWEEQARSPVSRALASPALTAEARRQVQAVLRPRLLEPLAAELRARGASDPELRAELLVSLAVGIAATRSNGSLPSLAKASLDDVVASLRPLVDALASDAAVA